MNEMIQKVLGLPSMVSDLVLKNRVNDTLDNFDSGAGIRTHMQTIYTWIAFGMMLFMLWNLGAGASDYFSTATGMGLVASIVTTAVCLVAAFALPSLIVRRAESFSGDHHGMASFLFGDVVATNIRLVGELGALTLLIQAVCLAVATVFQAEVYVPIGGQASVEMLMGPVNWVGGLYSEWIPFDLSAWYQGPSSDSVLAGSWTWDSVMHVAATLVNAVLLLAMNYVLVAAYRVGYNAVSWGIKWVQNPHLPIRTN